MIISVWRKANFLDFRNFALRLHFLFFLFLFVKKFIIVYHLANRRIRLRRDFHQVETLVICYSLCFCYRINTYFYIFTNQSYLRYFYHVVGPVFLLLFFSEPWIKCAPGRPWWKCH